MTLFVALAAALAGAALLFLLPPLLRGGRARGAPQRAEANAAIYREQRDELAAERARGALSEAEYERALRELERRIVAEHAADAAAAAPRPALAAALALALVVPLSAGLLYWKTGNPGALQAGAEIDPHKVTPEQMAGLVERLWMRMQQKPDDLEGWLLLGRSLTVMGDYQRAAQSYGAAAKLAPDNPDLLADYADVLAMAQGGRLEGEPAQAVQRALKLDPQHVKSLALAGTAEFERQNFKGAIAYWERLLKVAPPQSEFARSVNESIAEARGLDQAKGGKLAKGPAAGDKAAKPAAPSGALAGVVRLDTALAGKAAPGDTVFILARAAEGPRMPLAIARTTVDKLPYRFSLDDSMAMAPGMTISSQPKVVVLARISRSGKAAPEKGDIEGMSAPVAPGAAGIDVVLSRVLD